MPTFFTAAEWSCVVAMVARLIPDDAAGAGGVQAGVPEFIDRQLEMPYGHGTYFYKRGPFNTNVAPTLGYQLPFTPRELYRAGIAEADQACLRTDACIRLASSDREVADVVSFIRDAWGNRSSSVTHSDVASLRKPTRP